MPASKFPGSPSKFPPKPLSSKFPASPAEVSDTGPSVFLDGQLYYRQIGDLVLSLCTAKTIGDAQWGEFLDHTLRLSRKLGRMPKAVMSTFTATYPDAMQRRQTSEFLRIHGIKPIDRLAVLSDNPLIRGAIVAFGWVVPNASFVAYRTDDVDVCLAWLREVAMFDEKRAATAWYEARTELWIR